MAGAICAISFSGKKGAVCAAAVPWFGMLAWLLYREFFVPYSGGGASMWPVAQLFGGTAAAVVGLTSYLFFKRFNTR